MKSSFGKLRKRKEKRDFQASAQLDEVAQDMRKCYDTLLSAAAATANSAYEFSESLRQMGSCLLETTELIDDEGIGNILSMLGKAQLELHKLVDGYRSHVILTITNPSESLLNELQTVEEMKRRCDEKRKIYEHMLAHQREKGKSRSGKGENFTSQQLRTAYDEYDDEATLCVFRLKSLKQGHSLSLLTQAARHHAAQLNFFRKGLKSLDAVEPHLRSVTERQHIDYQFTGLEDDEGEDVENDGEDSYVADDKGELSFDYRQNKQGLGVVSKPRNSMELDPMELSYPLASTTANAELNLDQDRGDVQVSSRERTGSHSAPILAEKKFDPVEVRRMQLSTQKLNTYVLPTPVEAYSSVPSRTSTSVPRTRPTNQGGRVHNMWHSSPLEPKKHEKDLGDDNMSGLMISKTQLVLKESNSNHTSIRLPLPLAKGFPVPQPENLTASDSKKVKRQALSGPLTSEEWSTKPVMSASTPMVSTELPHLVSGLLSIPQASSSPKVSPSASPPPVYLPKVNELHELPRPPGSLASKPAKCPGLIGHSAPLIFRNQVLSATNKIPSMASNSASPLPTPPLNVPRSFSIPSSSQRAMALHAAKLLDSPQIREKSEDVESPPLTPISIADIKRANLL